MVTVVLNIADGVGTPCSHWSLLTSGVVATYERQIPLLADLLLGLVQQKQQSIRQLQQLFTQHPDYEIFCFLARSR